MDALEIVGIPVLDDNYVWLAHEPRSRETVVIDPAVDAPVVAAAEARGWRITQIWNTHWHSDHRDGNVGIKAATGCTIAAPALEADRIPAVERALVQDDLLRIGDLKVAVMAIPGHTLGHLAFHIPAARTIFVGDTLFAMGCGRLFEGTAAQMFINLRRMAGLPGETRVYCAHEYTQSNGRFALVAEPGNRAIARRMRQVDALRAAGQPTVPTTIALELATNPFMRAQSAEALAALRAAKDTFRG